MIGRIRWILFNPVFLTAFLVAAALIAMGYATGRNDHPIHGDGWGYYAHLPAIFVYQDFHLSFLNDPDLPSSVTWYRHSGGWQGMHPNGDGFLNKYAFGPAVMQMPFFFVAMAIAKATLPQVTGFEAPFQLANALSGIFYFALGCFFVYRTMRLRYSATPAALALAFAVFATNLLFYATKDGSYAHVYGFCLVAGLFFLVVRRVERGGAPPLWEFALFGLLMGVAVMVRPTNAIVALLYIVFIRRAQLAAIVRGSVLAFAASVVGALPQMLLWLATTGRPIYYSYTGEGFHFEHPSVRPYLFLPSKGVFFWHPAYLIMLLAAVAQIPVRRLEGAVVFVILGLNLYIGASWGDPTFGDTFGCRQIVEMIPLMMMPMAALISGILKNPGQRLVAAVVAALLITLNTVQFYGYVIGTLPHNHVTLASYAEFWRNPFGL